MAIDDVPVLFQLIMEYLRLNALQRRKGIHLLHNSGSSRILHQQQIGSGEGSLGNVITPGPCVGRRDLMARQEARE